MSIDQTKTEWQERLLKIQDVEEIVGFKRSKISNLLNKISFRRI